MSSEFYVKISKESYLATPERHAWNCVLYYVQFTQEELLYLREWIEIREVIKYQTSVTKAFLREHFFKEINDWTDVEKYVKG